MSEKTISLVARKEAAEMRMRREQRIDRYIQSKAAVRTPFPPFTLPFSEVERLLNAPFEEKEVFYRADTRRFMMLLAAVAVGWLALTAYHEFFPAPKPSAPPAPVFEPAGVVQDIQLQSTTFSTDTTVKTTAGIYQVHGGVSAATGDIAQIKREGEGSFMRSALCIESKIKAQCYPLL